jgi:hypothetical protein
MIVVAFDTTTAARGAALLEMLVSERNVASAIAEAAWWVALRGGAHRAHAIRPVYVRRPDAGLVRDRRRGAR